MKKSVEVSDEENEMLSKIGKHLGIKHDAAVIRYLIRDYYRREVKQDE